MSAVDTQNPPVTHDVVLTRRSNPFVTSFLPGLVIGLVVGAFASAVLIPMWQAGSTGVMPQATQRRALPTENPGDAAPKDGPANEQRPSDTPGAAPMTNDPNAPAADPSKTPDPATPAPAQGEPRPVVP